MGRGRQGSVRRLLVIKARRRRPSSLAAVGEGKRGGDKIEDLGTQQVLG